MIESRSPRRTLFEALAKAKLSPPTTEAETGEAFLLLLLCGVDCELTGTETWYRRIIETAPERLDERALDDDARRIIDGEEDA
jgi:hypothetical protein